MRRSGLIAITLDKGDELLRVQAVEKGDEIVLATKLGQSIRFKAGDVREMGRSAAGVRGVRLDKGDEVVGADVIGKEDGKTGCILVLGEMGYGKRTKLSEYKIQGRAGSGIKTMAITKKTGPLVFATVVTDGEKEIVAISKQGQVIRTGVDQIPTLGRSTQGVRVMKLREGDSVATFLAHDFVEDCACASLYITVQLPCNARLLRVLHPKMRGTLSVPGVPMFLLMDEPMRGIMNTWLLQSR